MNRASYKKLAITLFLLAALANGIVSSAASGGQKQKEPLLDAEGGQIRPAATRGDCNFLNDPNILGDKQKHIRELSILTAMASRKIYEPPLQLPKAPIPINNFIDQEIFGKMERDKVAPAPLSSDEEFIRRISLDLTGRIPTVDQVRSFVADKNPDKRNLLIDSLIRTPEFVDRWTMWLGDLLQNTAFSSNINRYQQGRNAFYATIKQAVQDNTPYNQFVSSLLTANGNSFQNGAVNYIIGGITPMGPIQDTQDTLVVQTSKRFLGIDTLDCLLCHNGEGHTNALNLWATGVKREQAWGMSAFFSRTGLRANRVSDMPLIISFDSTDLAAGQYNLNTNSGNRTPRAPVDGKTSIMPQYLFTGEKPFQTESYRASFARFLTKDRQFARAAVNYLWEHFFGLGIVDPPTGFDLARIDPKNPPPAPWDLQPSHPELLEKLADDFIASGYNLQQIMRRIAQSSAYQLSARYNGEWKEEYTTYFARKLVRRLDAEEMHDAIARATGLPGNYYVFGFQQPIQWAMQLPDTIEPIPYRDMPQDQTSIQLANLARLFMNTFQRGDRDQVLRSGEASILQGLTAMNSQFVNLRINANNPNGTLSRLLGAGSDNELFVRELFLTVLSRQPSDQELAQSMTILKANRAQGAEDLMWALMNKIDFLYNY